MPRLAVHTPRPSRLRWLSSLLLLLALSLGLTACAGSGVAANSGSPTRITLRDYRTGLALELVNDAYDDRVEYYSRRLPEGSASRKFTTDRDIDGLLAVLDDQGFEGWAQEGSAPRDGATVISSSIEVERNGRTRHWKIGDGSDPKSRDGLINSKKVFTVLYQQTPGYQAIDNAQGSFEFREPASRFR